MSPRAMRSLSACFVALSIICAALDNLPPSPEKIVNFVKNIINKYYVNALLDITKLCDCCKDPEGIVLEDIGVLLGKDIVSIEKASLDLINKKAGKDLFKDIHHKSPLEHIKEAERLKLGSLDYELIKK